MRCCTLPAKKPHPPPISYDYILISQSVNIIFQTNDFWWYKVQFHTLEKKDDWCLEKFEKPFAS